MTSQYEQQGGSYTEIDGVLFPNLLAQKQEYTIGKYGRQHLRYLKEHRRVLYMNLKTTGKLNSYLHDFDTQASEQVERIVWQMAAAEGTNERSKATDPQRWTGLMNNYRSCAEETIPAFETTLV